MQTGVLYLLAALTPLSYGPPTVRTLWAVALPGAVLVALATGRVREPRHALIWITAALFALMAVVLTFPRADDIDSHWRIGIQLALLWAVLPPVMTWASTAIDTAVTSRIVAAFMIGQTVSAGTALLAAVTGNTVLGSGVLLGRASGLGGHPNILGIMSAVAVLIWFGARLGGRSGALVTIAGIANLMALFVSGSISSLVALVTGAAVIGLVHRIPARRVGIYAVVGILGFAVATQAAEETGITRSPLDRIRQTSGQTDELSTLALRQEIWAIAVDRIDADPLGGVGFDDASGGDLGVDRAVVHNMVLRSWYQGGPLLFLAVVLILMSALAGIRSAFRSRADALPAGVLAALIMFALTSASLYQPYYWLLFVTSWVALRGVPTIRPSRPSARRPSVLSGFYARRHVAIDPR